jgi:hypothetical protein
VEIVKSTSVSPKSSRASLLKRLLLEIFLRPDGNWAERWLWPPFAVLGLSLMVCFAIGIVWIIGPYSLSPFPKWALRSAFDGESNPLNNPRLEIVCRGFDCEEVIPFLPAVTGVRCSQGMGLIGACCGTGFGDVAGSEVHIYWKGFRKYRIELKPPMCRNPDFAPAADPDSPEGKEWIRCDELWRSRPPASRPSFTNPNAVAPDAV